MSLERSHGNFLQRLGEIEHEPQAVGDAPAMPIEVPLDLLTHPLGLQKLGKQHGAPSRAPPDSGHGRPAKRHAAGRDCVIHYVCQVERSFLL
jgi:hypothetical protein